MKSHRLDAFVRLGGAKDRDPMDEPAAGEIIRCVMLNGLLIPQEEVTFTPGVAKSKLRLLHFCLFCFDSTLARIA